MALQSFNQKGFRPSRGDAAKITMLPVAASQTLTKGDAVFLDSGQVKIAVAATAALLGVIAQDAVLLAENTMVAVWADYGEEFIGRCNSTSASLTSGAEVDLEGTTGAHEINENASTTDVFRITGELDPNESTGSAAKQFKFIVNLHQWQPG